MPKPPAAEPENVWKEIIAQAQVAGNGAQDCGARHAGDTVNPDSNDERPAGCRSPAGERGRNTDFTGWPSTEGQTGSQYALEEQKMNEKSSRAVRQALRILRKEKDDREARIEYHETVGMLRGLYYGGEIDSMELVALTQLAGSAYINAGKPW
ncbi:hypothetical protein ACQ1XD_006721 [Pseudomonas aeruginosa]|uniref:hypothetical protein n=1 Tax=Pseudomonas aeruginosa TaxID=287 RepID=UPI001482B049|nr:hypothetical protein [Pseudomonas aeruginosa]EIU4413803.1 hypothetical protein [Pseudomonas aeruginosa]EKD2841283.1 hypothetical protein [Pseudomonas aeruginosa]EKU8164507.1 hypothetical protein [Pseudomonas aeruginosa]EKU9141368.1 hypothetical protein [Pseudomonas aeruginosa]EKU9660535.1 hypothetical protein [Pseudomonas aeruginosa]